MRSIVNLLSAAEFAQRVLSNIYNSISAENLKEIY